MNSALIAGAEPLVLLLGITLCFRRSWVAAGLWLQGLALAGAGGTGAAIFLGASPVGARFQSSPGPAAGIDRLSGFFIALIAVAGVPVLVFAVGTLPGRPGSRSLAALTGAFAGALVGVVAARDPVTFLLFWELMTVIPATAILVARRDPDARRSTYVYLSITHLGGVGVWLAILLLAHHGAIGNPAAMAGQSDTVRAVIAIVALLGFGTKAGLMPVHSWLPRAHPVAPSHISAVMSGVMIKVAVYGLIRVIFEWMGPVPVWLGFAVVIIGLASSFGGVLYAVIQHELKRLLAFHSIENIGIVTLGLGASLVFAEDRQTTWAAIAFAAALLHCLNHAVFKSLLFLGAGAFHGRVHDLHLDRLGGLLRRMPFTGAAFLAGAVSIAGLPPFNGFASEWLVLQSLLHLTTGSRLGEAILGAVAAAGLAATAALAVFCFVKVVGLVLLGMPRRPIVAEATEVGAVMWAPIVFLAAVCAALGVVPGLLLPRLTLLAPTPVTLATTPAPQPGLSIPGTGALPTLSLALVLAGFCALLAVIRGRTAPVASPVWACGQPPDPALNWTSGGFTKPLRLVLASVLRPERSVVVGHDGGIITSVTYASHTPHLIDTVVLARVVRVGLRSAAYARRIQSGSIRVYVAYLVALLLLLLLLVRIGALG